jgi:FkbM family methyltransferase
MPNPLYRFPLAYTQTPIGPFIYIPTDEYVGKALQEYGWYSPSESHFLQKICRPNWRVANIGAQMGYVARVFDSVGAHVDAFEPQPGMFDVMKVNAALGQNINPYRVAVGETVGMVNIPYFDYSRVGNFGAINSSMWTAGEQITQTTLDTLDIEYDLIQIDAEGMELEILKGGTNIIEECKPILFLENDRPDTGKELIKYIESIGYVCFWVITPLFQTPNPAQNEINVFPNTVTFNMICFPKTHAIRPNNENDIHIENMYRWCQENLSKATPIDEIGKTNKWLVFN